MQLEVSCHHKAFRDKDIQKHAFIAAEYGFQVLSVCLQYLDVASKLAGDSLLYAVPIDYPMGNSTTSAKIQEIIDAKRRGADIADIVVNNYWIANSRWDKFEDEIKKLVDTCYEYRLEPRVVIDFSLYDTKLLLALAAVLKQLRVFTVVGGTGTHHEYPCDNLAVGKKLQDDSLLNVVCEGHIWQKSELETFQKSKIFGLRIRHVDIIPALFR